MSDFARYLNIRSAIMPVFSADSRRLAFLTDISGNFQAWSILVHPGAQQNWPQQLTFLPDKVWELYGNPVAPQLVAVSDVGGNERQQLYLITGYGSETDDEGHEVRRLTSNGDAIHRFGAWSADGRRLVYTSNARNGLDFDPHWLDLNTGEVRLIAETPGNREIGAWSPDGRFLLMLDHIGPLQTELYLLDLETGQEHHLTASTPPACYSRPHWTARGLYLISDRLQDRGGVYTLDIPRGDLKKVIDVETHPLSGEIEALAVSPDGQHAAYIFNADGYSRLYLLSLGERRRRAVAALPEGVIGTLRFSSNGHHLVLDLQTPNHNPDIWLVNIANGKCRQLTHSNRAGIPRSTFVLPQLARYPSFDGLEISAFYYLPQGAPPPGGYPCILYVHGGPTDQARPNFDVSFQYFLSQGYAMLAPNVRGSSGYGHTFAALDEVEKRLDSVVDLKYAVEWLKAQPEINAERLAIYGRSYGGFMVLAALTEYSDLFVAGIDVVGISNWVTFLERTGAWRRGHREQEYGSLEQHRELLERISPIHKAEQIKVPLMVLAGDNDPRVPLSESEQIVRRVEAAGGIVKFVHYPDEGHKFSKLSNRIDSFTQMADFLRTYL